MQQKHPSQYSGLGFRPVTHTLSTAATSRIAVCSSRATEAHRMSVEKEATRTIDAARQILRELCHVCLKQKSREEGRLRKGSPLCKKILRVTLLSTTCSRGGLYVHLHPERQHCVFSNVCRLYGEE